MTRAHVPVLRVALLAAAMLAQPIQAGQPADHEAEVARCIRRSAHGRQWLERTLWGLRDQEGGWAGAVIRNGNGSADLGPLQINSWWVPRLGRLTGAQEAEIRRSLVSDICFNVDAARWIFLSALRQNRTYWSAVGGYHSRTPSRQQRYAQAVADKLRRRFGQDIFTSSQAAHTGAIMENGK